MLINRLLEVDVQNISSTFGSADVLECARQTVNLSLNGYKVQILGDPPFTLGDYDGPICSSIK